MLTFLTRKVLQMEKKKFSLYSAQSKLINASYTVKKENASLQQYRGVVG